LEELFFISNYHMRESDMKNINIWIIEDEEEAYNQNRDLCEKACNELGLKPNFKFLKTVEEFKKEIPNFYPDMMLVDLRLGEDESDRSGWKIISEILERKVIPVIVYTAYSDGPPDDSLKNILIFRVLKGDELIYDTIKKFLEMISNFKSTKAKIEKQFEEITFQTTQKLFGERNVKDLQEIPTNLLNQLAVTRLCHYLLNFHIDESEKRLPESIFIYPILEMERKYLLTGDFIRKVDDGTIWLVSSPSCDLVIHKTPKVENVLLLRCYLKSDDVPFLKDKERNSKINNLKNRLKRGTIKIQKCPAKIFDREYILISFKNYQTLSYQEIIEKLGEEWIILSSLAFPYSQDLQNLFIRDLLRLGTPDVSTSQEEEKWIKEFCSE